MKVETEIFTKLTESFQPTCLEIEDQSELHRGHSGWREGGETHFSVKMVSDQLSGMSRIEMHRLVHAALTPDPLGRIHALSLDLRSH